MIATYEANDDESVATKDLYQDMLSQTIRELGNDKEIVLIGDLNIRIDRRINHHTNGSYGEDTSNNNGKRLIIYYL